jgi:hypothetical protein
MLISANGLEKVQANRTSKHYEVSCLIKPGSVELKNQR